MGAIGRRGIGKQARSVGGEFGNRRDRSEGNSETGVIGQRGIRKQARSVGGYFGDAILAAHRAVEDGHPLGERGDQPHVPPRQEDVVPLNLVGVVLIPEGERE
eukprot:8245391-Pyramimonas_sp.AAC.1